MGPRSEHFSYLDQVQVTDLGHSAMSLPETVTQGEMGWEVVGERGMYVGGMTSCLY